MRDAVDQVASSSGSHALTATLEWDATTTIMYVALSPACHLKIGEVDLVEKPECLG